MTLANVIAAQAERVVMAATQRPWVVPDGEAMLYSFLVVAVKAKTAGGKWIRSHMYASLSLEIDDDCPDARALRLEMARMSLRDLVRRALGERHGIPGHRGWFRLTEIEPVA